MDRPNVVLILADDMGYGDLSCLNADSKIDTPHVDRLAAEGMTFTDAHASSAVCSPSRYSILTGRYAWRGSLQRGVLGPLEAPLIEPDVLTWPEMLRAAGYHTACIGKWHLGLDWPFRHPRTTAGLNWRGPEIVAAAEDIDCRAPIRGGPLDRGFDRYFGVDVPNFPPYCFIEGDHAVGVPRVQKPDAMFGTPGPMLEGWDLEAILPALTRRAVAYVEERAAEGGPFFLYFPLTAPHTPIAPIARFRGKSRAGIYGDFVMQVDHVVGQVSEALRRTGQERDTLLIVTSDNGSPGRNGSLEAPGTVIETYGHNPSWILRGMKADAWDGGHRIPFIARWPGQIPAGARCDALICLMDLMATHAAILGCALGPDVAEDSFSILPYLLGERVDEPIRDALVHHSSKGMYGLRRGPWKLIAGQGSGGFSPDPVTTVYDPPGQLYHMGEDIRERHNRYRERPDLVYELSALLAAQRYRPTAPHARAG